MAVNDIVTLGVKVDPRKAIYGSNKAKRAIKGIGNTARRVKDQIFSLNGALGVLGAGAVLRSALKYTSTVENLGVRLKFLTGSTEDAGKAFKTMLGFAKQAPFTLQEIQNASPSLLTVADNVDELNQLLEITGDIATVSGLSFEEVGQQLQRSFSGGIASADLFRDSGVKAMLGFQTGVSYTAEQTKKIIVDMWKKGQISMVGATKELAKTFTGQVSMMSDAWDALTLAFMKEGIFDETKSSVQELTEWLKSPEVIQGAKDLGAGIKNIGLEIKDVITSYMSLPEWVRNMGLAIALFGGVYGRGAALTLAVFADEIKDITNSLDTFIENAKKWSREAKGAEVEIPFNISLSSGLGGIGEIAKEQMANQLASGLGGIGEIAKELESTLIKEFKTSAKVVEDWQAKLWKSTKGLSPLQKLTRDYEEQLRALNLTFKDSHLPIEKQAMLIDNLKTVYEEAVSDIREAKLAETVKKIATSIEDSMTTAFMNMTQGLGSFKEFFHSVVNTILEHAIRLAVVRPILASLGMGGGSTGFLGSLVGGFMGMAGGGNVNSNQPYTVGESGKEVFVPNRSGRIVPNHQLNTGTGEVRQVNAEINFNVQAIDANSFNTYLVHNKDTIEGIINSSLTSNGSVRRTINQVA